MGAMLRYTSRTCCFSGEAAASSPRIRDFGGLVDAAPVGGLVVAGGRKGAGAGEGGGHCEV